MRLSIQVQDTNLFLCNTERRLFAGGFPAVQESHFHLVPHVCDHPVNVLIRMDGMQDKCVFFEDQFFYRPMLISCR